MQGKNLAIEPSDYAHTVTINSRGCLFPSNSINNINGQFFFLVPVAELETVCTCHSSNVQPQSNDGDSGQNLKSHLSTVT